MGGDGVNKIRLPNQSPNFILSEKNLIVIGIFIHAKGEIEDFRLMN